MTPEQVVASLEQLDYFQYAEQADLDQLKLKLGEGLSKHNYLPFIEGDAPKFRKIDPRQYVLDNETLFEQDGIIEALEAMRPFFIKLNIKMEITDHFEEWDDETGLDHLITLNGKQYTIFHQWNDYGWGEAAQRFTDIINHQLGLQNSDERLYLIHGGNDGRCIFLTSDQYSLTRSLISDMKECPLPTKEWCELSDVTWKNLTE